ncbi:LacI family DNA-binding transcriptional regulator [Paenibacillus sp. XY044]|uniref:LacI family DNA-binding transcriptional regulator n=1 Tax=Paenibacillus sp. XY044 TaxID=2026089 RepID=UPI000B988ACA|nr:LacI family DNA-binding transcriptional regulator [Paenibacillus sp. XY044]OZB95287.1 LacI family transcriptional regulator [Paenibacillus sp. XY044]
MVTIADVAKAAGVSKGTVSSVFSKKRPISKEVTERVLKAAEELNYRPNYWARSLVNRKTNIIGLNMRSEKLPLDAFQHDLLDGMMEVCYEHGYRILINILQPSLLKQVERIASDPVDGEILLDPIHDDPRIEDRLKRDVPVVVVGRPSGESAGQVCSVDNDNIAASAKAVRLLLSQGHRRILFLNSAKDRTVAEDRELGYYLAHREAGLDPAAGLILNKPDDDGTSIRFGYETTLQMLREHSGLTAVLADNDSMAMGVYQAAEEIGLNVPGDLSVIAFSGGGHFPPTMHPPLTGMRLDARTIGMEAARLLIEQVTAGAAGVKRILIPSELVERGSCASTH